MSKDVDIGIWVSGSSLLNIVKWSFIVGFATVGWAADEAVYQVSRVQALNGDPTYKCQARPQYCTEDERLKVERIKKEEQEFERVAQRKEELKAWGLTDKTSLDWKVK